MFPLDPTMVTSYVAVLRGASEEFRIPPVSGAGEINNTQDGSGWVRFILIFSTNSIRLRYSYRLGTSWFLGKLHYHSSHNYHFSRNSQFVLCVAVLYALLRLARSPSWNKMQLFILCITLIFNQHPKWVEWTVVSVSFPKQKELTSV